MGSLKRILLAEDDSKDVELILTALEEHKLANEVVVTHDGAEALDYLFARNKFASRPKGNPAVMLLDLIMPKMDGLEVLRKIKADAELKTLPVGVLTSSRESSDLDECYRLGVNAYVVKPVKFSEYVDAVKELGIFWALINEPPSASVKKI